MISREEVVEYFAYCLTELKMDTEAIREAYELAIEDMQKQIPKKPIAVDWSEEFEGALIEDRCAVCSTYLHHLDRYCSNCGQAIDWSDIE